MLPCCADALCGCDLLENIRSRPHEVFLNDLMFLLSQEYKVPWLPPCYTSYAILSTSPLNPDICNYIRKELRFMYAKCELQWYIKCRTGKRKSVAFQKYTNNLKTRYKKVFNFLMENNVSLLFWEIIKIALQCIVFYEAGMHDALSFGVTGLTEVFDECLKKTGRTFQSILDSISGLIPNLPKDHFPSQIIEDLHEIFARDLLFYLCDLYNAPWFPQNNARYRIQNISPLSSLVRIFISKISLNPAVVYDLLLVTYLNDFSVFRSFKYALIVISEEISSATIPEVKTTEQVLTLCIRTAAFSVEIYKRGMCVNDILSETLQQLSEALRKCNRKNNGRVFYLFEAFAFLDNEIRGGISSAPKPLPFRYFSI